MPRGGPPERSGWAAAAIALAAGVVVHLAGATATVRWEPHANTNCGTGVLSAEEQFESLPQARERCQERGPDECFGIYNMWCEGETIFLCSKEAFETADDLDFSSDADGGSCTEEMIVTPVTSSTAGPSGEEGGGGGGGAADAAPPTTAPSGPTPTTDIPPADAPPDDVPPCQRTCTSPLGAGMACFQQILAFRPGGTHTGSMPHVRLTCQQKRAMVAHLGDCEVCGSCDVCETTKGPVGQELVEISYHPGTPSNFAAGLLIAAMCVAMGFCAAGVGRRFGFDPMRSQQAGEYILAAQVAGQAME